MSFTKLRNILKDPTATPEQQYAVWAQGFDEKKLGKQWILHLMDITRKGMGITQQPKQPQAAQQPVAETRLFNALVRPVMEVSDATKKSYKDKAQAQVKELEPHAKKGEYKDIAQRAIQRREKGLARVKDVEEARMSAAVKLQRAFDRERAKSDASRRRGEEVMAQAKKDAEKKSKEQGVAEADKLQGTPVVSLKDFGDKDNTKDKYGRTVPKKLKKDDPRVKFHKEPKQQGVAEAKTQKTADRYHINHPDRPATLASYKDKESAIKDRDAKYPGAKVHQVGPRGKVKGEFEEGVAEMDSQKPTGRYKADGTRSHSRSSIRNP